ncbi:hypothetical protein L226DRAFT_249977 [Lentinus tigrinus ALCF2SS1-7]|uniref:uncharacterized protein n=1 Tax=Lentinus tigrinus ALCF2SS1-7 TaxID=1328758 RepID=UPI001165E9C3|nr:hypothetical protein L226DRAFT_249977 [Lentinus tigrinus ALCF2SS1-7]
MPQRPGPTVHASYPSTYDRGSIFQTYFRDITTRQKASHPSRHGQDVYINHNGKGRDRRSRKWYQVVNEKFRTSQVVKSRDGVPEQETRETTMKKSHKSEEKIQHMYRKIVVTVVRPDPRVQHTLTGVHPGARPAEDRVRKPRSYLLEERSTQESSYGDADTRRSAQHVQGW